MIKTCIVLFTTLTVFAGFIHFVISNKKSSPDLVKNPKTLPHKKLKRINHNKDGAMAIQNPSLLESENHHQSSQFHDEDIPVGLPEPDEIQTKSFAGLPTDGDLYLEGFIDVRNKPLELLSSDESASLFDFKKSNADTGRRTGNGMGIVFVFQTGAELPKTSSAILRNGHDGLTVNLGADGSLQASLGEEMFLSNASSRLAPNRTYAISVSYNSEVGELQLYDTSSKRLVQVAVPVSNYSNDQPLLLGGTNSAGGSVISASYQTHLYRRTLSQQQMAGEAEDLCQKWISMQSSS